MSGNILREGATPSLRDELGDHAWIDAEVRQLQAKTEALYVLEIIFGAPPDPGLNVHREPLRKPLPVDCMRASNARPALSVDPIHPRQNLKNDTVPELHRLLPGCLSKPSSPSSFGWQ